MFSEELRKNSAMWVDKIKECWSSEIQNSIDKSIIERNYVASMPDYVPVPGKTKVIVEDITTEDAVRKYAWVGHTCVLNFASYKSPGGLFVAGSMAQEEALCHASSLYPVLKHFQSEYDRRSSHLNRGMYNEDFIYSPDILFSRNQYDTNDPIKVDVLTYAAPCMIRKTKTQEYYDLFAKRMVNAFIYPVIQGVDIYIIGAWGCGVFANSAAYVSQVWDNILGSADDVYKMIIHPVPFGRKGTNLRWFKNNCKVGRVN